MSSQQELEIKSLFIFFIVIQERRGIEKKKNNNNKSLKKLEFVEIKS